MSAQVESRRQQAAHGTGQPASHGAGQPAPHGTGRSRAVPAEADAEAAGRADGADMRALLENLDVQIVAMVLRRAALARHYHAQRRTAGLPQSELAWENQVLGRYAEPLGSRGTDIGRAVLALSQAAPRRPGTKETNGESPRKENASARTTESARGDPPR
ncbi:hypothetical protein [Streptomyces sp. NPDC094468]|uniref:hypothetical protein n=1 Tax=Streptomyces sp. NPDC094468 TaxID=3366066 RepID=UPI00380E0C59